MTALLFIVVISISACTAFPPEIESTKQVPTSEITVLTHDSFQISEQVLQEFESESNIRVRFLKGGDTGTVLNKAILSKNNPLADVFYGVDNTFLGRALDEDIFQPYQSPMLTEIDPSFVLDPEYRVLPINYGNVCINFDKTYFQESGIPIPQSLGDLISPQYSSMLVVQNPALSSPGLSFLLVTIANYGDNGYLEYWQALKDNDVKVVNDWEAAYYTEFSGSSGQGSRPMVVSYDSSPAFELIYAEDVVEESSTGAMISDQTCFSQVEFVGILKGTKNQSQAARWIDFMLSNKFQNELPFQMFVFPVNKNVLLDETFTAFLADPDQTVIMAPDLISDNRETWINQWNELMLR
jgi:thiamine transport system substrate-binding protein